MDRKIPHGMRYIDWVDETGKPSHKYVTFDNLVERFKFWAEDNTDEGQDEYIEVVYACVAFILDHKVVPCTPRGMVIWAEMTDYQREETEVTEREGDDSVAFQRWVDEHVHRYDEIAQRIASGYVSGHFAPTKAIV